MTKVYLSGPMTGLPQFNYPAFHAAAKVLRHVGYEVVNPAENTITLTAHQVGDEWRTYMRHDIKLLVDCEAIVLLPGWTDSRGATLERAIAQGLGLQVMDFTGAVLGLCEHA